MSITATRIVPLEQRVKELEVEVMGLKEQLRDMVDKTKQVKNPETKTEDKPKPISGLNT